MSASVCNRPGKWVHSVHAALWMPTAYEDRSRPIAHITIAVWVRVELTQLIQCRLANRLLPCNDTYGRTFLQGRNQCERNKSISSLDISDFLKKLQLSLLEKQLLACYCGHIRRQIIPFIQKFLTRNFRVERPHDAQMLESWYICKDLNRDLRMKQLSGNRSIRKGNWRNRKGSKALCH